ncbi:10588_t:CDS:2, partial [Acaulospora colombiana]
GVGNITAENIVGAYRRIFSTCEAGGVTSSPVAIKCFQFARLRNHADSEFYYKDYTWIGNEKVSASLAILMGVAHLMVNQWNESFLWVLKVFFYLEILIPYELRNASLHYKDFSSSTTCSLISLIQLFSLFWWLAILSIVAHIFMVALFAFMKYCSGQFDADRNKFVLNMCQLMDVKRPENLGNEKIYETRSVNSDGELNGNIRSTGWGICNGDERRLRTEFRNSRDPNGISVSFNTNSNSSYVVNIYASEDSSKSNEIVVNIENIKE